MIVFVLVLCFAAGYVGVEIIYRLHRRFRK